MKLSGWQWLALLGIIYISFILGAMFGSEVIYIVEDSPTVNNGWTEMIQEVSGENHDGFTHRDSQVGYQVVRLPENSNRVGATWWLFEPWESHRGL